MCISQTKNLNKKVSIPLKPGHIVINASTIGVKCAMVSIPLKPGHIVILHHVDTALLPMGFNPLKTRSYCNIIETKIIKLFKCFNPLKTRSYCNKWCSCTKTAIIFVSIPLKPGHIVIYIIMVNWA